MTPVRTLTVCFTVSILISMWGTSCDEGFQDEMNLESSRAAGPSGIIGGTPTGGNNWKGVVSVMAGGGMCSGTLIHPQVVLTAGHCVRVYDAMTGQYRDYTSRPGQVSIRSGANTFQSANLGRAKKIVPHPSWTGELSENSGDLSLILLQAPVNTSNFPVYKLRDFPAPVDGEKGLLVGYGATGSYAGSGTRRSGNTTLIGVASDVIETGNPANTCQGDSGGPLFTEQNGDWVVTGVTSFGNSSQCFNDYGSYSVNLTAYCTWVDKTMQELVGEGLGLDKCSQCSPKKASTWGAPCGDGYDPCPKNTKCRAPEGFSNGKIGYCAPDCCNIREADKGFCTNVADGDEICGFVDASGDRFCAIHCENNADCPDGTSCKNRPWESEKICIATEKGPGGPGTATDLDSGDGEEDEDEDEDDGDGDGDDHKTNDDNQKDGNNANDGEDGEDGTLEERVNSSGTGCSVVFGSAGTQGQRLLRFLQMIFA